MLPRTSSTLVLCCAALLPSVAWPAEQATVTGTGEASVRVSPTKLRMQVPVVAHGKTAELAIQRLKVRGEAVADNLCALGAEKKSLILGDPSVNKVAPSVGPGYPVPPSVGPTYSTPMPYLAPTPAAPYYPSAPSTYMPSGATPSLAPVAVPAPAMNPQPHAIEPTTAPASAPMPSTPAGTYGTPAAPVPPTIVPRTAYYAPPTTSLIAAPSKGSRSPAELYVATATLTVNWPLKVKTVDQAVLAAEAIRKKILSAGDLMGGKAAEKLPADEQELLDEGGATITRTISRPVVETDAYGHQIVRNVQEEQVSIVPGGPGVAAQGTPLFLYVAEIGSPDRKALLTEAFDKARVQAAEMAQAAGGKLGAVKNVSGEVSNPPSWEPFAPMAQEASSPGMVMGPAENSHEAVSGEPGSLKFTAKVHALFLME
jgi:uncharacterized protein YggE